MCMCFSFFLCCTKTFKRQFRHYHDTKKLLLERQDEEKNEEEEKTEKVVYSSCLHRFDAVCVSYILCFSSKRSGFLCALGMMRWRWTPKKNSTINNVRRYIYVVSVFTMNVPIFQMQHSAKRFCGKVLSIVLLIAICQCRKDIARLRAWKNVSFYTRPSRSIEKRIDFPSSVKTNGKKNPSLQSNRIPTTIQNKAKSSLYNTFASPAVVHLRYTYGRPRAYVHVE